MSSVLNHPQLLGAVAKFVMSDATTLLSLRRVSRNVGSLASAWMVDEVCEFVLEPAYPLPVEWVVDIGYVCWTLQLVPCTTEPLPMESRSVVSRPACAIFAERVLPRLLTVEQRSASTKAQRQRAAEAWSGLARLLDRIGFAFTDKTPVIIDSQGKEITDGVASRIGVELDNTGAAA